MKKIITFIFVYLITVTCYSQNNIVVPLAVKRTLKVQYPGAGKVTWEKEKGNYEANWGGISGEDNSVQYTPDGAFIEIVKTIKVTELPADARYYIKSHYQNASITEAGKIKNAKGKISYEAEIKGKDLIFDSNGNFIKTEK